ncbi:MAG: quinol:cytochrome C oxidoreductase [Planctomycetota bacterium]
MQPHDTPATATDAKEVSLGALARPAAIVCGLLGVVGLAVTAWLGFGSPEDFRRALFAYLTNYTFFLSISLGGLFFVLVQHATRAGWSVNVRRLAEIPAANFAILLVLFLPILLPVLRGNGALYVWADHEYAMRTPLIAHKIAWLNPTWVGIRCVGYFAIWWALGGYYFRRSLSQDRTGDAQPTLAMERWSPLGLLLYALTITFAAFDLLMSLTPEWYSTIFGVYYFSGAAVAIFAFLPLAAALLQVSGRLAREITTEHYHDLGKLLFGFTVFWGYIAFSQYMLIWYANIPEETVWYQPRHHAPWATISLVLLMGHLIIPFFGLLSRQVKRQKWALAFWAGWLMVMHWIDLYWLVMPAYSPDRVPFGAVDVAALVGIGGIYMASLFVIAGDRPLTPLGDPRRGESLAFENM